MGRKKRPSAPNPTPPPLDASRRSPRPHGRSLLMVAAAWIVALSKNPEIFNQVTWVNGTLRLTVTAVPVGAEVQV